MSPQSKQKKGNNKTQSKIENQKQQGKTVKPKLFMKINKIDQPLAQTIKRKDIITQIQKEEVTSPRILRLLER